MYQVLIIDDDVALTQMLAEYLQQNGFAVDVQNSPLSAIAEVREKSFDIVLLDVMMPELDGFETLKQIRAFSIVPVIMLTAKGEDYDRILGLELGADDYLAKPFNHRELLARMKALTRRLDDLSSFNQVQNLEFHGIKIEESSQRALIANHTVDLTSTEFHLLVLLMKHAGHLLSKEKLSEEVLGRRLSAFDRSLDMHVSNVRKKLAQHGIENVIKTTRGSGYIFMSEL
ncbi:response regulator transcription factor [Brumicola nitratireducens]|uniref:Transcriptional regulatory protein CpxR n=1 Tax=Glaciecola nitratireducens (strain JCM 12485 / KCTC 12276 / FR1064) TaxID=1085623 RepID=G4QFL7_GLANF|nr:response regulator transcription factor [Glaciecola nitratireducens]AEP28642.1 Transcriptional regulatory protein CpxR [Glaciecola nitratireducens FR1064]